MPTSSDADGDEPPGGLCFDPLTWPDHRLHPRPQDAEDFPAWRDRVRAAVRARGDCCPPAGPVSATLLSTARSGDLAREQYLLNGIGAEAAVTLLRPARASGALPTVLVCPGANAVVAQVTGAEPPDYPDRDIAVRLSAAGFVTLTLDYRYAGRVDQGRKAGRDDMTVLAQLYDLVGRSLLGALVRGAGLTLAWLGSQPGTRPGQVALFGHSLGGAVALHAALAARELLPLCVASHLGSYRVLGYGHPAAHLPGIAADADLPDLYAALAPAPLHLQYGLADRELDPADAQAAGEQIAELYRIAGAGGRAEVLATPMGHGTAPAPAIDFLRRALARQARPCTAA